MSATGEAIRCRLQAAAKARGTTTDHLLGRWAAERFLARLSASPYRARLVLKGGSLFTLWSGDLFRSTSDVDLHGDVADIAAMGTMLLAVAIMVSEQDDGVSFAAETATFKTLKGGRYPGVRMQITASLGTARTSLKVDVGFGHAITPGVEQAFFPSLLPGQPSFKVGAYPRETVVAEKLAVIVEFGSDNTRLRDYYDLWLLSQRYSFLGHVLQLAVSNTFDRRDAGTFVQRADGYWEAAFSKDYATCKRERSWTNWVSEHAPKTAPPTLQQTLACVAQFGVPLLQAIRNGSELRQTWSAGVGWQPLYASTNTRRSRNVRLEVRPSLATDVARVTGPEVGDARVGKAWTRGSGASVMDGPSS